MHHPSDVTSVRSHTFAVSDSVRHRLVLFDISRDICSVLAEEEVWPNSLTSTAAGHLVVTDRKSKEVLFYDLNTGTVFQHWRLPAVPEGEDWRPHGIAVDSHGQILVTDTLDNCLHVFTPEGKRLRSVGSGSGRNLQQLILPFFCAVDPYDNILISDNLNYSVKSFDSSGNFKFRIGSSQDWGQRQFQCPYGVCADEDSNVIVADYEASRISMYDSQGQFVRHILSSVDGCNRPCGVTVGPCGTLVVTECREKGGTVTAYNIYRHRESVTQLAPFSYTAGKLPRQIYY